VWSDLLSAFALVFVLEGILPFLNPNGVRRMYLTVARLDNHTLRFIGLTSMLAGVVLLYFVR